MCKRLIIIGAGGHGKVVADIALLNGYDEIFFLDDNCVGKTCAGFPVVGKVFDFKKYENQLYDFIVAIGNAYIREKIQNKLARVTTLIHPKSTISRCVSLGMGTVVMAGAVINSDAKIGKGCIINTSASVDHDSVIGDFVHVAVGAHLAGNVIVGTKSWIGIGACVKNNVKIIDGCMIGAGSVVVNDISTSGTYVGVPAKLLVKGDRF